MRNGSVALHNYFNLFLCRPLVFVLKAKKSLHFFKKRSTMETRTGERPEKERSAPLVPLPSRSIPSFPSRHAPQGASRAQHTSPTQSTSRAKRTSRCAATPRSLPVAPRRALHARSALHRRSRLHARSALHVAQQHFVSFPSRPAGHFTRAAHIIGRSPHHWAQPTSLREAHFTLRSNTSFPSGSVPDQIKNHGIKKEKTR